MPLFHENVCVCVFMYNPCGRQKRATWVQISPLCIHTCIHTHIHTSVYTNMYILCTNSFTCTHTLKLYSYNIHTHMISSGPNGHTSTYMHTLKLYSYSYDIILIWYPGAHKGRARWRHTIREDCGYRVLSRRRYSSNYSFRRECIRACKYVVCAFVCIERIALVGYSEGSATALTILFDVRAFLHVCMFICVYVCIERIALIGCPQGGTTTHTHTHTHTHVE